MPYRMQENVAKSIESITIGLASPMYTFKVSWRVTNRKQ